MALLAMCALAVAAAPANDRIPLSTEQITELRDAAHHAQRRNASLKSTLSKRQAELMAEYTQFELNESRIDELHEEVIRLQRELLVNYRRLQVELRQIVGADRFPHLKRRIDYFLEHPPKEVKQSKNGEAKQPTP